jgi:hypothetical protein
LSLPAVAGGPANVASHELAIPRRDMLPRVAAVNISVLHLQRPNVNWVLHSAERAANTSAPCASHAVAGYKPAGPTGQRPVFHRNTDLQSVRPAEFHSAECATHRVLCQRYSGLQTRWAHRPKARVPNL